MDSDLSLEFLRVVEQAAIACAHTMGLGDWRKSDQAAVETMRKCMDSVPISDGDLSAGIAAAVAGSGVHAVMGIGGAPAGVLTAAAMRCLNGEIFGRLMVTTPEHEARSRVMGISDFRKVDTSKDLASGGNIIFAATGVTEGTLMKGVRFFGDGVRTSSLLMQSHPARIRFIDTIHVEQAGTAKVRF